MGQYDITAPLVETIDRRGSNYELGRAGANTSSIGAFVDGAQSGAKDALAIQGEALRLQTVYDPKKLAAEELQRELANRRLEEALQTDIRTNVLGEKYDEGDRVLGQGQKQASIASSYASAASSNASARKTGLETSILSTFGPSEAAAKSKKSQYDSLNSQLEAQKKLDDLYGGATSVRDVGRGDTKLLDSPEGAPSPDNFIKPDPLTPAQIRQQNYQQKLDDLAGISANTEQLKQEAEVYHKTAAVHQERTKTLDEDTTFKFGMNAYEKVSEGLEAPIRDTIGAGKPALAPALPDIARMAEAASKKDLSDEKRKILAGNLTRVLDTFSDSSDPYKAIDAMDAPEQEKENLKATISKAYALSDTTKLPGNQRAIADAFSGMDPQESLPYVQNPNKTYEDIEKIFQKKSYEVESPKFNARLRNDPVAIAAMEASKYGTASFTIRPATQDEMASMQQQQGDTTSSKSAGNMTAFESSDGKVVFAPTPAIDDIAGNGMLDMMNKIAQRAGTNIEAGAQAQSQIEESKARANQVNAAPPPPPTATTDQVQASNAQTGNATPTTTNPAEATANAQPDIATPQNVGQADVLGQEPAPTGTPSPNPTPSASSTEQQPQTAEAGKPAEAPQGQITTQADNQKAEETYKTDNSEDYIRNTIALDPADQTNTLINKGMSSKEATSLAKQDLALYNRHAEKTQKSIDNKVNTLEKSKEIPAVIDDLVNMAEQYPDVAELFGGDKNFARAVTQAKTYLPEEMKNMSPELRDAIGKISQLEGLVAGKVLANEGKGGVSRNMDTEQEARRMLSGIASTMMTPETLKQVSSIMKASIAASEQTIDLNSTLLEMGIRPAIANKMSAEYATKHAYPQKLVDGKLVENKDFITADQFLNRGSTSRAWRIAHGEDVSDTGSKKKVNEQGSTLSEANDGSQSASALLGQNKDIPPSEQSFKERLAQNPEDRKKYNELVTEMKKQGVATNGVAYFIDSLLFNKSEEAGAAIDSVVNALGLQDPKKAEMLRKARQEAIEDFGSKNPKTAMALDVASVIVPAIATMGIGGAVVSAAKAGQVGSTVARGLNAGTKAARVGGAVLGGGTAAGIDGLLGAARVAGEKGGDAQGQFIRDMGTSAAFQAGLPIIGKFVAKPVYDFLKSSVNSKKTAGQLVEEMKIKGVSFEELQGALTKMKDLSSEGIDIPAIGAGNERVTGVITDFAQSKGGQEVLSAPLEGAPATSSSVRTQIMDNADSGLKTAAKESPLANAPSVSDAQQKFSSIVEDAVTSKAEKVGGRASILAEGRVGKAIEDTFQGTEGSAVKAMEEINQMAGKEVPNLKGIGGKGVQGRITDLEEIGQAVKDSASPTFKALEKEFFDVVESNPEIKKEVTGLVDNLVTELKAIRPDDADSIINGIVKDLRGEANTGISKTVAKGAPDPILYDSSGKAMVKEGASEHGLTPSFKVLSELRESIKKAGMGKTGTKIGQRSTLLTEIDDTINKAFKATGKEGDKFFNDYLGQYKQITKLRDGIDNQVSIYKDIENAFKDPKASLEKMFFKTNRGGAAKRQELIDTFGSEKAVAGFQKQLQSADEARKLLNLSSTQTLSNTQITKLSKSLGEANKLAGSNQFFAEKLIKESTPKNLKAIQKSLGSEGVEVMKDGVRASLAQRMNNIKDTVRTGSNVREMIGLKPSEFNNIKAIMGDAEAAQLDKFFNQTLSLEKSKAIADILSAGADDAITSKSSNTVGNIALRRTAETGGKFLIDILSKTAGNVRREGVQRAVSKELFNPDIAKSNAFLQDAVDEWAKQSASKWSPEKVNKVTKALATVLSVEKK